MNQQTILQHFHRPACGNGNQTLVAHMTLNFLKQALHVLGLDRQQDKVAFLYQLQVALHDVHRINVAEFFALIGVNVINIGFVGLHVVALNGGLKNGGTHVAHSDNAEFHSGAPPL